ncbi:MAG: ABC transporter permease [Myxococcales bacterium]|nr:ABC transporter permease [Myxococcales bacterium]
MELDRLREIGESLWRHRLRTALTALSVAWGTYVLVVLLGTGQGLQNSVAHEFRDDATNSIWMYRGESSRPFEGLPIGRPTRFDNRDFAELIRMDGVEHATGRFYPWRSTVLAYEGRTAEFDIRAVHPGHQYIERSQMTAGRYIDELDLRDLRKVLVIGKEVERFLFRGVDPIGEWVTVAGVPFRVVGVFEDAGGESEMRQVYMPITTAQATFGSGTRQIHQIMFSVGDATIEQAQALADQAVATLASRHRFDPADTRAVRVRNNVEQFERVQRIFRLVDAFVWLVGVGTITAGIVGVSNIMLVSVRERTNEIGLRKALGATPARIVSGIVAEALMLTAVAGYCGIVGGVATLEVIRNWMPDNDYLREPEVTLAPALAAAVLLTLFGALAGFVPAWRAAQVQPVDALRAS